MAVIHFIYNFVEFKLEKEPEKCKMKGNARMEELTGELKKMTAEELREHGDKYKELLEQRDLEDILYK